MNDTKKVGRPRKFDKDAALLAAMNVFWKQGYEGSSMKDLTRAMGIEGPSLYAAFGDKRSLFLQAIERYASHDGCAPLVAFEEEPELAEAVRRFFIEVIEYATNHESGARGCFLTSCVATTAGNVEGVDLLLSQAIDETDHRLADRFEREKKLGNLRPDFPSLERARFMFDLRQGFVFRARSGGDPAQMLSELGLRVQMVLA